MVPKKKGTAGTGGSIERDLVRRWVRRQLNDPAIDAEQGNLLRRLLAWLGTQPVRTKRPGGIGR